MKPYTDQELMEWAAGKLHHIHANSSYAPYLKAFIARLQAMQSEPIARNKSLDELQAETERLKLYPWQAESKPSPAGMRSADVKKLFEDWVSDGDQKVIEKSTTGDYRLMQTRIYSIAWQAAWECFSKVSISTPLDADYQSGRGITGPERGDDDLLAALNYWGDMDYKSGCEMAHYILLVYRDRINAALASVTPPTRSDGEGWALVPAGWAIDRFRLKERPTMGEVFLENTGNGKWSVFNNPDVLNKNGKWEYQPMPSARDDYFIKRCRFYSAQEAADAFAALLVNGGL